MSYRYRPGLGIVAYIIITCAVLWIATTINQRLLDVLAFYPPDFARQPWTIITSMFVHANILHVLFNMITLYFFGTFLVNAVGQGRFLMIYLVGGLAGNLLYWFLAVNHLAGTSPNAYLLGASGAIFAAGGALAVLRPRATVYMFFAVPMPLWLAVVIGLALTLGGGGAIAWQAHLGGAAAGALIAFIFRQRGIGRYY